MTVEYEGRIINGRPVFVNVVDLPENTKITIIANILKSNVSEQADTFENDVSKKRAILKSITGIIKSDVDVKTMRAERIAKRGLLE